MGKGDAEFNGVGFELALSGRTHERTCAYYTYECAVMYWDSLEAKTSVATCTPNSHILGHWKSKMSLEHLVLKQGSAQRLMGTYQNCVEAGLADCRWLPFSLKKNVK